MIILLVSVLGLVVGSFLNVVIYRSGPAFSNAKGRGRFRLGGRSFCPFCKKQLRWFELIPLISFAIQKRRCRGCDALISWRYPLVEGGTGILFSLIAYYYFVGVLPFPIL